MKKIIMAIFTLGIALLSMVGIAEAQDEQDNASIYRSRSRQPRDGQVLYPTIPGTNVRDYMNPRGYVVDDGVAYPTIPGTNVRDYMNPRGFVIEND